MEREIREAERLRRLQASQVESVVPHIQGLWNPEEDTSHAGCWIRYASFVLGIAVAISSTLFTAPAVFLARVNYCQRGCFSLEHDLKTSLNHSVHPCDDFYGHVCSGWDSKESYYTTPLDKYSVAFSRSVIKAMLLERVPVLSKKTRGKAARFMLRCISRVEQRSASSLKTFLHELGLSWPHRSAATRPQLLDIFVRASLHFGMPLFWAVYIGRHPLRPLENTIYMTLDPSFKDWVHDMDVLTARGKESQHLRRGAEVIGGEGQSYSVMIHHVLQAHADLSDLANRFFGEYRLPEFHSLTDPDLRRALNGYLPDESQLWPEDEIINLQPKFFHNLDNMYLSESVHQERFNLFLGAYAVWMLSPFASGYLTSSMLADMGHKNAESIYRCFKCFEALEAVMPLVKFHLHRSAADDIKPLRSIARLSTRSLSSCLRNYGESEEKNVATILQHIALNAFNMTSTWRMLDDMYAYLPAEPDVPTFFELYRRAAMATATFFTRSLRRPKHSTYHVPGIIKNRQYRLLTIREASVEYFLAAAPLYGTWQPATVLSALSGTIISVQLATLIRFTLFFSSRFQLSPPEEFSPGARGLYRDGRQLAQIANESLPNASVYEIHEVAQASFAVHAASYTQWMAEWRPASAGGGDETKLELDRLFFYLVCYSQCGTEERERLKKMAACNVALPAAPRFRKAFNCGPQHRLVTDFTWPEPPLTATAEPS
ncbi:uncharacterized protein LOC142586866 [Dermacentor variabilis]|uniref:uncharacterized protein LOC142586866 n=1 Tax=Dermacentor variabilis TaxID=34621 RepID=UPI003F5BCECE